ncbi:hypothetical protein BN903_20 [Halorubrum sp. AJ67]|nr:hypothetical protein BN903_20 [Halorubrum sp. AJ67]
MDALVCRCAVRSNGRDVRVCGHGVCGEFVVMMCAVSLRSSSARCL